MENSQKMKAQHLIIDVVTSGSVWTDPKTVCRINHCGFYFTNIRITFFCLLYQKMLYFTTSSSNIIKFHSRYEVQNGDTPWQEITADDFTWSCDWCVF